MSIDDLPRQAVHELGAFLRTLGAAGSVLTPLYPAGTLAGDFQRAVALLVVELLGDERLSSLTALVPRLLEGEVPASRRLLELAAEVLLRDGGDQEESREASRAGGPDQK